MENNRDDTDSISQLADVGAVVVHHHSLNTIAATIDHIVSGGVLPGNIVLVDNSEQSTDELSALINPEVKIRSTANDGYGAAVNAGVAELNSYKKFSYILVSTHEATPDRETIRALRKGLANNPNAAVAGPLLTTDEGATVWSSGGYFTKWLNLPRHIGHNSSVSELNTSPDVTQVDWIDGAFMLYRSGVITETPMDESFFLYMEEADHHVRLKALGWQIICMRSATVGQTSNGIPDYYLGRNMYRFQARSGTRFSRTFAVPAEIARRKLSHIIKGAPKPSTKSALRGWMNGISGRPAQAVKSAVIVNPIAAALAHYSLELSDVLERAGYLVLHRDLSEPSMASYGRIGWVLRHIKSLIDTRISTSGPILITWAPLGLYDLPLARLLCGRRAHLVIHDPIPLVRSIGYGKLAGAVVAFLPTCTAISHSALAAAKLEGRGIRSKLLPHPAIQTGGPSTPIDPGERPKILVFGQYKPDRDVDLMAEIAAKTEGQFSFRVVGRGWPDIPGWSVESRFIDESEVSDLLLRSTVVLIPYRRFFQSGVAIRCLELGRPFVGPKETSLTEIVPVTSRLLTAESAREWIMAIEYAVEFGQSEILEARDRYNSNVDHRWRTFLHA